MMAMTTKSSIKEKPLRSPDFMVINNTAWLLRNSCGGRLPWSHAPIPKTHTSQKRQRNNDGKHDPASLPGFFGKKGGWPFTFGKPAQPRYPVKNLSILGNL